MTTPNSILAQHSRLRYQQVRDQIEREVLSGKYAPGHKLPSLMDLSRAMGVNHLTVRRGLNELAKRGLVETQPRVGTFVKERPASVVAAPPRIMLGLRSFMLKFKVSGHHPAIASYMAALDQKQHEHDFVAQIVFYQRGKLAETFGRRILDEKINGFIIADGDAAPADHEFFKANNIKHVYCGAILPSYRDYAGAIVRDSVGVLREAVNHLYELGHRRIAYVVYPRASDREIRDQTFRRLLFDRQMCDARNLLVTIEEPQDSPRWEQVESVFDIDPKPTAVIVEDEFLADVLLAACNRRGVNVPGDLSVVALSDLLPFGHRLPLTAPDSPAIHQQMIERAVDKVVNLVRGMPEPSHHEVITQELMPRASSGPCLPEAMSPVS